MINHTNSFTFIHIPRCGGNFINKYFDAPVPVSGETKDKNDYEIDHYPAHRYEELYPNLYSSYKKITFIRNPWDRLLSEFHYKKYGKTRGGTWGPCTRFINCSKLNFKQFVSKLNDNFNKIAEHKKTNHWLVSHFLSFHDYLSDPKHMDYIGRVENFDKDFEKLCNILNVPYKKLPKHNSVTHKHYTEYYDDRTVDLVYNMYSQDIDYFEYKFGD